MISSVMEALVLIKIQPYISEQETNDTESMICLT